MKQEYLVNEINKVKEYIDNNLGLDYDTTQDTVDEEVGSIIVFDIKQDEHMALRKYIIDNNLWEI